MTGPYGTMLFKKAITVTTFLNFMRGPLLSFFAHNLILYNILISNTNFDF